MTPTYLQSANAPSLGDICRAGTIVIALGGIVVGPKIEFLHQSPTSASELAVGAPHETSRVTVSLGRPSRRRS